LMSLNWSAFNWINCLLLVRCAVVAWLKFRPVVRSMTCASRNLLIVGCCICVQGCILLLPGVEFVFVGVVLPQVNLVSIWGSWRLVVAVRWTIQTGNVVLDLG
jgi:hypothetical protein